MFTSRKRLIEEMEQKQKWAVDNAETRKDIEYAIKIEKLTKKHEEELEQKELQCEKALEFQQTIYDKKIIDLNNAINDAFMRGRNEVLDWVKNKVKTGEFVKGGHSNNPNV